MGNKPLTFEELSAMDGQYVWVEDEEGARWGRVSVEDAHPPDSVCISDNNGTSYYINFMMDVGAKFYRQPPDEHQKTVEKETVQSKKPITPNETGKVQRHKALCDELNTLYAKKNADYGDSFHETFKEEGFAMARIRLSDKLNRFKTLSRNAEQQVVGESMRDTLIDLANYALMTVLELDELEERIKAIPHTITTYSNKKI